ncbi:MAG: hypothetical protein ACK551_04810 [Vampirovibrionales bacterium]
MIQQAKKRIKSGIKAGFSLVEVSFVMLLVGAVIIPIVLNQNAQSKLDNLQVQSLENLNLTDTELLALLASPAKKAEFVEEITDVMMDLAAGAKIVDNDVTSKEALYDPLATTQGNYLNTLSTFFNDTGGSGQYKYDYKFYVLPIISLSDPKIETTQKTFFLETSNGKYVPVFTYKWQFRDQSSNNNDETQNTSTGTYFVRAELKIYDIPSPVAQTDTATVAVASTPRNKTTHFNVRNEPLVQKIKAQTPRVLINFTFDMSRGACYSPATSQYSRRLTGGSTDWAKLSWISYNSGKGLLCAPYFAPSTNNSPSSSPWNDGLVSTSGGALKPEWYDIYYNKQDPDGQLFWTNGAGPAAYKETETPQPGISMGHATFRTSGGAWKNPTENPLALMYSMPDSGNSYTLRIPKLTSAPTRNFPDGDFDKHALNYIRCMSFSGKSSATALDLAGSPWAGRFYGPNLASPSPDLWMQRMCKDYNSSWVTPSNNTLTSSTYYDIVTTMLTTFPFSSKKRAFSRFWVRQNGGNFGGNTFVTLEAARMAITSNESAIYESSQKFWADGGVRTMDKVSSGQDGADEEARWISGVEFQRSAALMTIFKLLSQVPETRQKFEVSVTLNNPSTNTDDSGGTTYKAYPHDSSSFNEKLTKGTIGDTDQFQFKEVMKHLYGMNRLLGSGIPPSGFGTNFTNAGSANYRHLANEKYFKLKDAIINFRTMLKETAQLKCQQDKGSTLVVPTSSGDPCHLGPEWGKYLGHDHYVNVIYFPSDMSGDSTVVNPAKDSFGVLNTAADDNLQEKLKCMIPDTIMADAVRYPSGETDWFNGKITYVLVVHNDTYTTNTPVNRLHERVEWLRDEMEASGVDVVLKKVEGPEDYETYLNTDLFTLFTDKAVGGKAGWSKFNNMKPDDYVY